MSGLIGSSPFVSRAEWGARAPRNRSGLPASRGNTVHYEGPHMGSFPHASCPTKVRGIQAFHMDSRGWSDVAYSTIVCPHGTIFDGRGFGVRTAAQGTNDGNNSSHAHCFLLGDGDTVPDVAKRAMADVIGDYRRRGSGGQVWGHRDWHSTSCPGDPAYAWVKAGMPVPGVVAPTPGHVGAITPRWVAAMATPTGGGYWEVNADGGVRAFGDAIHFGDVAGVTLHPIVGAAATLKGDGYWLCASDGGVFAFGAAPFCGSAGGVTLNKPVVGMAARPQGDGYWLVADDGGIFTYGAAVFAGSAAG